MSTVRFISIRDKLTAFSTRILVSTMLTLTALGATLGVVEYRNNSAGFQANLRRNLESKGRLLVTNNGLALRGMAEDNAFLSIRELVGSTVREDIDIIYGVFMDAQRRPWAMVHTHDSTLSEEKSLPLDDSISRWAGAISSCGWREYRLQGDKIVEFAAPVVGSDSTRLGTIRYGVSTSSIQEALSMSSPRTLLRSLLYPGGFLGIGLLLFLLQSRAARHQAEAITRPLYELTGATQTIASGDYGTRIGVETNDEVGTLAQSFESMRSTIKQYTGNLESMVAERTEQLKAAQQELVEKAHRAGMADIATGTLHNVGNILNSVRTSADVIMDQLTHSPVDGLERANELLRQNLDTLDEFVARDPRGRKLMQYYLKLGEVFKEDHEQIRQSSVRLSEKVNAIGEVIAAQQSYAGVAGLTEAASLAVIVEDALRMQSGSIERYSIAVRREFDEVPKIPVQKAKLVHVLINLLKNAKEAMFETPPEKRAITVSVTHDGGFAQIKLRDTGAGIAPENLTRIFNHGFTTKKGGHGFGLHSSANYLKEMGGSLCAESDGTGKGAVFILKLPLSLNPDTVQRGAA